MLAQWELSDISVLFPLPPAAQPNQLWSTNRAAKGGKLLPREVFDSLPRLMGTESKDWIYEHLRVVAMRIDPCFREGRGPCQRQVRLVWQPVRKEFGVWTTDDAAIHTFYSLSEENWTQLISTVAILQKKFPVAPGQPLGVHPVLKTQGMEGEFATTLGAEVFSLCGPGNLRRATAITVNGEGTVWVFTGFDIDGTELKRIQIPLTKKMAQGFFTGLENAMEFTASISPAPEGVNAFLAFLKDSAGAERSMGEAGVAEAVKTALSLQNPRLTDPGNTDCASCHAARAVPFWAKSRFPTWNAQSMFGEVLFQGPGNLSDTTSNPARTNVLRAFGYFGKDPVVSPRTVNDTSASIEFMNR